MWAAIVVAVIAVAVTTIVLSSRDRNEAASTPSQADANSLAVDPISAETSVLHEVARAVPTEAAGVSAFAFPNAHASPRAITIASDGTMWVALQSQGAMARIDDPSDDGLRFTEFKMPESGSNPFTPVIGPDASSG